MKILFLLLTLSLQAHGHIFYLMKQGEVKNAIQEYRQYYPEHDFTVLRQMALTLLQSSAHAREGEGQLLGLFGAGVTESPALIPLIRTSLESRYPEVQMAAINLLARFDHDAAPSLLKKTLGSPLLPIRAEALYQLALMHDPGTVGHLESLMAKVPGELKPLFPQLFGLIGSRDADRVLHRFLADSDPLVRRAAIVTLAEHGRDDYLETIRSLSKQIHPLQQEVCAVALGLLQDSSSISHLEQLIYSGHSNVRVAAMIALYKLGRKGVHFQLENLALEGDPFAIFALRKMEESEPILKRFLKSPSLIQRINATCALLEQRSQAAAPHLTEILIEDTRDLGFLVQPSMGGGLQAIRPIASLTVQAKKDPALAEVSRSLRETLLVQALELPEKSFLSIAKTLFKKEQNDLVPLLVTLLQSLGTEEAYHLLEKGAQQPGSPLIRNYCNLALFRSEREGPWEENLHEWIRQKREHELFQLRPLLSWDQRREPFSLTPEETSRLLIESFEALANRHDLIAVEALLDALQEGNQQNIYPLAGLLFRITE